MADTTNVTSSTSDLSAAMGAAVATSTAPVGAAAVPSAPAKRNPLDILEDILDNAEAQKAENKVEEEKQQKDAELKAKEEEVRQQDLHRIEEERAKMANIGQTPEEQARQLQQQEKAVEQQNQAEEQKGYEIVQLGHTKI
ncbi:hypothetical protein KJZ63_02670 [Patescibacteria group bacterium]|nr:hypothetical protein [Patescibacteria group bacterium]